jgi:hypothetical protein
MITREQIDTNEYIYKNGLLVSIVSLVPDEDELTTITLTANNELRYFF